MWIEFTNRKKLKLNKPKMVIAVSTSIPQYRELYSQAREMAEYMLKNVEAEEVATVHSSAFSPEVSVRGDGTATLQACHVHLIRGKQDLLLFSGDSSPMEDQYEFAQAVLDYAEELGVKEIYSIGARWSENPIPPEQDPEVIGFSTDKPGVTTLKKEKVKIMPEEPAPFFASMVVAMAAEHGIRGFKLSVDHGEPSPHPRSVARLLASVADLTGVVVPLGGLKPSEQAGKPQQLGDPTIYR